MPRNQKLFNQIAEMIEQQPQFYKQNSWADNQAIFATEEEANAAADNLGSECGTAYCICGWAVQLSATPEQIRQARLAAREEDVVWLDYSYKNYRLDAAKFFFGLCQQFDECGDEVKVGADLLGLDYGDADYLFHGGWSPQTGLTVPEALRKIGEGADVRDV